MTSSFTKPERVTIREVAELAGVSQMTVSRVVNDRGLVKEATRKRVEEAIGQLNYKPNFIARRLAGGDIFFVGLLYHNPSPSYLSKVLEGALRSSRKNGLHLVIDDMRADDASSEDPLATAKALFQAGLDGVILTPPVSTDVELLKGLHKFGIPTVRIASLTNDPESRSVAIDDTSAVTSMMQHLIDAGHKKIGFIMGPESHPSAVHRFDGYKKGLEKNNLPIIEDYIVKGEYTIKSGRAAAHQLFDMADGPTAIFASNDDMAAGAIAAANIRGVSVPADVSIVGFDDTEIAKSVWPMLTTIRQPISAMTERAVDMLADALRDKTAQNNKPPHIQLPYELIERDSVRNLNDNT